MTRTQPLLTSTQRIRRALQIIIVMLALSVPISLLFVEQAAGQSTPNAPFATTITVDTSADLNTTSRTTTTCTYDQGAFFNPAGDGCTLRRAIVEASARPQSDRPIAIVFNLANNDPSANQDATGTWTLEIDDGLVLKLPTILESNGAVTIDGSTQPGGRNAADGPKIIIDTNDNSLEVESENNVITNLAFYGGGTIALKENGNTVSNIWMGLDGTGQEIVFRTPGQPNRMAGGGVFISSDNNIVEDNTISGAFARAINIDGGDNNLVQNNQIGTRADGTVPEVPPASLCQRMFSLDTAQWYGGWGIGLSGSNNQILNNRIAGLQIVQTENSTPPMAIEIFGNNHQVNNNIIGVDSADEEVGVCGQGIKVAGNGTEILDNQIIRSRAGFEDDAETAIMAADTSPTFGAVTVRRNIVKEGPGNVYAFGPGVKSALRLFEPAKITSINGTSVIGTSGDDSPCPNCLIDFYSDNIDDNGEALTYLGQVTSDSNGDFSFTLPSALGANMGIRTSSTVPGSGIITGFGAGTTTKVSKLFLAMDDLTIEGPTMGDVGATYSYTITVGPDTATVPVDYTIQATDQITDTRDDNQSRVIVATYKWDIGGIKTISVTAVNDLSVVLGSLEVQIGATITGVAISGPTTGEVGISYPYTFTVQPPNAAGPFTYTVNTTDKSQQFLPDSPSSAVTTGYVWNNPGTKTINVMVETPLGSVTNSMDVVISPPPSTDDELFLPKLDK